MKLQIKKPTEVDVKFLKVSGGNRLQPEDIQITNKEGFDTFERFEDVFAKFPSLQDPFRPGEFYLVIDIETGRITNWPIGYWCNFSAVKVVDEGTYILSDINGDPVAYYQGYVPGCLQIEYEDCGDYWEFVVDSNGYIRDWEFGQSDLDELLRIN